MIGRICVLPDVDMACGANVAVVKDPDVHVAGRADVAVVKDHETSVRILAAKL